jgi:membrane protein YqaA with SNARE-associated domain
VSEQAAATQPRGLRGALGWPMRQLRRLYHWVLGWSNSRYGTPALFVISFAEASFFPIPPDPLLMALCLGKNKRALWYGAVCTAASVLGGILGWFIGLWVFGAVADAINAVGWGPTWFGTEAAAAGLTAAEQAALPQAGGMTFYPDGYFHTVKLRFDDNAFLAYFGAALTPIPFKVFTIAGGLFEVSLPLLIAGSIFGRGARFFGLAVLIRLFGDRVKPLIEKYFEWLTVALLLVGIAGFAAITYLL